MAMAFRFPYGPFISDMKLDTGGIYNTTGKGPRSTGELLCQILTASCIQSTCKNSKSLGRVGRILSFQGSSKHVQTACRISFPRATLESKEKASSSLRKKMIIPDSDPPSVQDVNILYQFFHRSSNLVVLTGAGISTECGIPDYRSPNGAYSTGFKPITHQEFMRSIRARRRYWARSYAGWRKFTAAQPGAAHISLASLEKAGRINFMITQNVDRLHHRAGSNPLELHGTVYNVNCTNCGFSLSRSVFQDQVKAHNKKVVFFGDNVPKDRADTAMEAAKRCDAFLVLGSSLMTMSAFRLIRAAHEAGAATAIVNLGETRADKFVPLKINARLGEILPRLLNTGSLSVPVPYS
ncbi:NAD-dependent protein deacylase SRT2 isoform X3 [Coffea eugenioides]|uniref:NAD-dependent protein deacylase SRT2 isoform X3 n=1 Tax=Coffea eugenioides TaxID=49369 RepID=UPI000F6128BC|nr:NAD-dependent protein deacylase SRT2 isoform X3 [Coffea eugenioides]